MTKSSTAASFALLLILCAGCAYASTLNTFFTNVEDYIISLANNVTEHLDNHSSSTCIIPNNCDFSGTSCQTGFGNSSSCSCSGTYVDTDDILLFSTAETILQNNHFCSFVDMKPVLKNAYDLSTIDESIMSIHYGSRDKAAYAHYPKVPFSLETTNGTCLNTATCLSKFDVRTLPWYSRAFSSTKVVVFMLDLSGSIRGEVFDRLLTSIEKVLEQLDFDDRVLIVPFSDHIFNMNGYNGFVNGTTANKQNLLAQVSNLVPSGPLQLQTGFEQVFLALNETSDTYTDVCSMQIIFFTDGLISTDAAILDYVDAQMEAQSSISNKTFISVISLTDKLDHIQLQKLACNYNGIFAAFGGNMEYLASEMSALHNFFLSYVHITPSVHFSFDNSSIITAHYPIFTGSGSSLRGVVGLEFDATTLLAVNTVDEVFDAIRSSRQCPVRTQNTCMLEAVRGSEYHCNGCTGMYTVESSFFMEYRTAFFWVIFFIVMLLLTILFDSFAHKQKVFDFDDDGEPMTGQMSDNINDMDHNNVLQQTGEIVSTGTPLNIGALPVRVNVSMLEEGEDLYGDVPLAVVQ
ncbi:hypothetical protein PCE1_000745 [Barthelona sp. PCE]